MRVVDSFSEQDTYLLGKELGEKALPGTIFCLEGDLGCGKTVLAKGMAKGLNIDDDILSPTFTIIRQYGGRLPFYHFDIYRLEEEEELFEIGFDEYLSLGGVVLIEWANQIPEAMPKSAIWIRVEKDLSKGVNYRRIEIGNR